MQKEIKEKTDIKENLQPITIRLSPESIEKLKKLSLNETWKGLYQTLIRALIEDYLKDKKTLKD